MARIFIYSFWTLMVQAISIFRDILLAKYFGTGPDLHAWLALSIGPSFIASAVLGAFPGVLVPWISPLSQVPSTRELKALAVSLARKIFLALLIAGVITLFFHHEVQLILAAVLIASLQILIGYLRGLIQSLKKISWVVGSPLISTAFVCLFLFSQAGHLGIAAFPLGLLLGCGIEAVILLIVVRHFYKAGQSSQTKISEIEKGFWGLVFAGLAMSATLYIDQLSAQWLFGGGIPELTYGNKVSAAIIGLVGGALSVLLFPRLAASRQQASFKKQIYQASLALFLVGTVVSLFLILFSTEIIQILFERGKFQNSDTRLVGLINIYFICQIPFYLAGIVGVYALQILRQSQIIFKIAVINTINNLILNIVLGKWMGLPGIALATAVVYFGSMAMIFFNLKKVMGAQHG